MSSSIDIRDVINTRFEQQDEYKINHSTSTVSEPLVSITVATYQHVNYIKQCLDGILSQKTDFKIEIVLGEDGSTDGTQEICKEYAEKYPDVVRLFIRDRKLSQYKDENGKTFRFNALWCRMSSKGKYIAWCEGDDYWTDPYKLQKQINFLESNPEYIASYGKAIRFNQNNQTFGWTYGSDFQSADNLLLSNTIPSLTMVFRKDRYFDYFNDVNPLTKGWSMGDYPIWLWFAFNGRIFFLDEVVGVYRVLEHSASHFDTVLKERLFHYSSLKVSCYFAQRYNTRELDVKILLLNAEIELAVRQNDKQKIKILKQEGRKGGRENKELCDDTKKVKYLRVYILSPK